MVDVPPPSVGPAEDDADAELPEFIRLSFADPDWRVRARAVEVLGRNFSDREASGRAIAAATHDSVDWVAFTAIRTIGERHIRLAVPDLIAISGWPSQFAKAEHARKPVGCGAAFTKRALLEIFATRDPAQLRLLEDKYFEPTPDRQGRRDPMTEVVVVPAGQVSLGYDTDGGPNPFRMDDTDNPSRTVAVAGFLIDRTAVTNERYARFLDAVGDDCAFDHPDQTPGASHVPAHWKSPRYNRPDQPVVGIDWYDAWAFAEWAGGRLPSEIEWEKAARGTDGRVYPWGNGFDPTVCNYADRAFGARIENLEDLEEYLIRCTPDTFPPEPVLAADAFPEAASPYGAVQMAGNVWEMTSTNFYTRAEMDPFFKHRHPAEFMNRRDAFHVLRGGAWSSPDICLRAHYRGKDLLTDRHTEVGFRCAYDLPLPAFAAADIPSGTVHLSAQPRKDN